MKFEFEFGKIEKIIDPYFYWNISYGVGEDKCHKDITLQNVFSQDNVINQCIINTDYSPYKLEENEWKNLVNNAIYEYKKTVKTD